MANLSSKCNRGFRIFCALTVFFLTMHSPSIAEDCPPCYYNIARPNTAGNGTSADGRPKLLIKIDSSWNVTNSGTPQSQTNASIWNALQGCNGCSSTGAADMWNSATGANGAKAPFFIETNQSTNSPNITITRADVGGSCAKITGPSGGPYTMTLPPETANLDIWSIVETIAHEIGHATGLSNVTNLSSCGFSSIMSPGDTGCTAIGASVTATDVNQARKAMDSAVQITCEDQLGPMTRESIEPTPSPSPSPECVIQMCEAGCAWSCSLETCIGSGCASPILIDVVGNGFDLTGVEDGVMFDIDLDGIKEHVSWTTETSDDAFLVLDVNQNGTIDNGSELFGNYTAQPRPKGGEVKNGFLALAQYDQPGRGGNEDGVIDASDNVFTSLRLWRDVNHNGVSELTELSRLPDFSIQLIELKYRESRRVDQLGNRFRYRAKVGDSQGSGVGRWAWDVFLLSRRE